MTDLRVGLANYSAEQWALLKRVADDPEALDDTYGEWLEQKDQALAQVDGLEGIVRLVDIDVAELMCWCRANGRALDGDARASFCTEKLREMYGEPPLSGDPE